MIFDCTCTHQPACSRERNSPRFSERNDKDIPGDSKNASFIDKKNKYVEKRIHCIAGSEGCKSKAVCFVINIYSPETRSRNDASDENIFISNH